MSKNTDKVLAAVARARGVERKEHFANGGTLASWRGVRLVQKDRKKEQSRKVCRGPAGRRGI